MTEKRFTYCKKAHYYGNILDNGEMLGYGDVVDVLNEQHETIQRLEAQLSHLEYRFTEYRNKVGKND